MGRVLDQIRTAHLSSAQLNTMINEWVHSARDRKILKAKLIHGYTYEDIADQLSPHLSPRQIKRIVHRRVNENIIPHI